MHPEGNVYVVDDDAGVRQAIRILVESVGLRFRAFGTATEFLTQYDRSQPGCLVLDVRLPGMSGIELHKQLLAEGAMIPVILVSGYGDIAMAVDAMQRGAVDFLEKPFKPQQLLDRIQSALAREAERRQTKAERDAIAKRLARLTARERMVVDLAVSGMTNKQIAAKLGVSSQAIDAQRARAMEKLQVTNVPELVQLVMKTETASV